MNHIIRYEELPWVDLYSERDFKGQLHRLFVNSPSSVDFQTTKLPKIGSVIVGPDVIAEFHLRGRSTPIRLQSGTVLPDASLRLNGSKVRGLRLAKTAKAA